MGVDTLGDALPREMTRVRDEVMSAYIEIGQPVAFALAMMRRDLDAAQKAMIEGDGGRDGARLQGTQRLLDMTASRAPGAGEGG